MSNMDKRCTFDTDQGKMSVFAKNVGLNRAEAYCQSINQKLLNINNAETIAILQKKFEKKSDCVLSNGTPMYNFYFHSGLEIYYGVGTWKDGLIYNATDPIQSNLFIWPPRKSNECNLIGYYPSFDKLASNGCDMALPFICVGEKDSVVPNDSRVVIEPSTCSFETKYGKLNAFTTFVYLDEAQDHCRSLNQELFVMNKPDIFDVLPPHLSKCAGYDDRHTLNDYYFHAGLQVGYGWGYWRDGLKFNASDPRQRDLFALPPMHLKHEQCGIVWYSSSLGGHLNYFSHCQVGASFMCVESNAEVSSATMNNESQAGSLSALHVDMNDVQNVEDGYSWQHIFFIMMVASLVIFIVGFIFRSWLRKRKAKKGNVDLSTNTSTQSVNHEGISRTLYNKDARFV